MNVELLKEEIEAARKRIAKDKEYIAKSQMDIALHLCPFEVGDRVVCGYGNVEIIASISYCSWSMLGYDFKSYKIKNDGKPYKVSNHCYDLDKYAMAV